MKKIDSISTAFLPLAVAGFGIIQLVQQDFFKGPFQFPGIWQGRAIAVNAFGVYLLACGGMMAITSLASWGYRAASCLFGLVFVYPRFFLLLGHPYDGSEWTASMEVLSLATGIYLVRPQSELSNEKWDTCCRYLFAFCLVVFGIQHFQYEVYIVTLIPRWIPFPIFWTYVIRFGFLLAAFSLVFHLQQLRAMIWLAIMFLVWVSVLHLPRALSKWSVESEWTSLLIALAISGIAFQLARRFKSDAELYKPSRTAIRSGIIHLVPRRVRKEGS
ncbi:MAG: hypothetical protein ACJ75B_07470 [Flavisolibacter sp.]